MSAKRGSFLKTTLLGGLTVILPVLLLLLIFGWLWRWVRGLLYPLSRFLMETSRLQELVASLSALVLVVLACFLIGLVVRTRIGRFLHRQLEKRFFKIAPGYNLLREIVNQVFGKKDHPFLQAALVEPFGTGCWMTGLITDSHDGSFYTVFLPSGLNPTTGLILHLPAARVRKLEVPVEEAMRTVIACGAGSSGLLQKFLEESKDEKSL